MNKIISRRLFLFGIPALLLYSGVQRFLPHSSELNSPKALFRQLDSRLYDKNIGNALRKGTFKNKTAETLFYSIRKKLNANGSLNDSISEDYKNGRAVMAQGWILPEITAEICALSALVEADVH